MSEDRPFFSVMTVTLDAGRDLERTGRSITGQDFDDWEWIVKDGGSTDGSLAALPDDDRVRLIRRPDRGIYHAMNQALPECRGRYIVCLGAGDRFARDTVLSRVTRCIEESGNPEIVYTHLFDEKWRQVIEYPRTISRAFLFRRKAINHQCLYLHRRCFEEFGDFDESFVTSAEQEHLHRLILRHHVRYQLCPIVGAIYQNEGFSANPPPGVRRSVRRRIRRRYFTLWERVVYGILWHATLPGLRRWLLERFPRLRGWYFGAKRKIDASGM